MVHASADEGPEKVDLVLFGPPGAGKGTQAKRLTEILAVPQISTGDMMRSERSSGSDLGKRFDSYMSQGLLVPDAMVLELVELRLKKADAAKGAIFDGYPRTTTQAESLDSMLIKLGRKIDRVVSIQVELDEQIKRITGRRTCVACGQVYHLIYNPPPSDGRCGSCGKAELVQRKDDTEEVIRKRHEEYLANTAPLLDYYGKKGIVFGVNGIGSLDEVTARIREAIGAD